MTEPTALPDASLLTPLQARVLAVLVEKEKTTPDVYPLTLNALTTGCNQKTARDPVMQASESEVLAALDELRERTLVVESYGASGRVLRYAHNFGKVYKAPGAAVALLATLMLRGPQTVSELRANSERLYAFADASSAEAYLEELADRADGAMAVKLPRQPGAREQRWAHCLCGAPVISASPAAAPEASGDVLARLAQLEAEVAALRSELDTLKASAVTTSSNPANYVGP